MNYLPPEVMNGVYFHRRGVVSRTSGPYSSKVCDRFTKGVGRNFSRGGGGVLNVIS